ncbi:MAG: TetR/AcrR family transcriptional regulator [Rhizomicrobium sp.]
MNALTQTRWRRRKAARPQEILEAALSVFAEKGFAAARMDDIAARAGVTKGTIYLYFESKDAVFKSLVRESIGAALAEAVAIVGRFEGSASLLLRTILATVGGFIITSNRIVLIKVMVSESGNFPELLRFYREEVIDRGIALISGVIAKGIAQGEFRGVVPAHAARLAIAPLLLTGIWRTVFKDSDGESYDHQGVVDTHIDTLLRGLAAEKGVQA